jgi:hypothetical protein
MGSKVVKHRYHYPKTTIFKVGLRVSPYGGLRRPTVVLSSRGSEYPAHSVATLPLILMRKVVTVQYIYSIHFMDGVFIRLSVLLIASPRRPSPGPAVTRPSVVAATPEPPLLIGGHFFVLAM